LSGVSSGINGGARSHSGPRRPRASGRGSAPSRSHPPNSSGGRGGGSEESSVGRTHTPGRSRQQRTPPSRAAAPSNNQAGDSSHDNSTFESPPVAQIPAARRPSTGKSPYMMGRFEDEEDLDS
jgi:hypothetical protein